VHRLIGSENETGNALHWYAVWSRSRHEKMVASALTNVGVTTFLPLVSEMHRWSDRRKSVDVPLFPGYVFVQILNSGGSFVRAYKPESAIPEIDGPPTNQPFRAMLVSGEV
jgi:transcription antitermination factor NusG